MRQVDGFKGIVSLADRERGKTISVTFWEREEAMLESREVASKARSEVAAGSGSAVGEVDEYEVQPFDVNR